MFSGPVKVAEVTYSLRIKHKTLHIDRRILPLPYVDEVAIKRQRQHASRVIFSI